MVLTARWAGARAASSTAATTRGRIRGASTRPHDTKLSGAQALFGIVQGASHMDLRRESLERTAEIGFDGYAIGGLSVGEEKSVMYGVVEELAPRDAARSPALPDGRRDAGRFGRVCGARRRYVRLRAADAQRANRPGFHLARQAEHQERAVGARHAPAGRGLPRVRSAAATRAPTCGIFT